MFVRFVVGTDAEHHRHLTGVITCARLLKEDRLLEPYEVDLIDAVFAWFNEHVPCPPFSESGCTRPAGDRPTATAAQREYRRVLRA